MKKIIDGRRYDTDTAKEIATASYGDYGSLHYWCETLYRKNNGEFFLYGEGGAASRYAEAVDANHWKGGEKIFPLSVSEARSWADENLDDDMYVSLFGDLEDETKHTVTFSLTKGAIETISRMAAEGKCTKSEVVENLVNNR